MFPNLGTTSLDLSTFDLNTFNSATFDRFYYYQHWLSNIDPMVPNRLKVIIEAKSTPAERDSSKRRSINGRSTLPTLDQFLTDTSERSWRSMDWDSQLLTWAILMKNFTSRDNCDSRSWWISALFSSILSKKWWKVRNR